MYSLNDLLSFSVCMTGIVTTISVIAIITLSKDKK